MLDSEYQTCLSSMYQLRRFGIKLELDTIEHILAALGNPQNTFRSIHIAGTNGKGSVAAMLSAILHSAGYCVGRYTSPHLERFNERICIDNQTIDDEAVVHAHQSVIKVKPGQREPTFFEFATAMALYEFGRRKVQWAVIETGMGGRMDATNAVQSVLSIITNISLEHKAYLGSTIAAIAAEKAGIIKPGIPMVTAVQQSAARTVIHTRATACGSPVYQKGRDFRIRRGNNNCFSYYGLDHQWRDLTVSLVGDHQIENASLVLAACEVLQRDGKAQIEHRLDDLFTNQHSQHSQSPTILPRDYRTSYLLNRRNANEKNNTVKRPSRRMSGQVSWSAVASVGYV